MKTGKLRHAAAAFLFCILLALSSCTFPTVNWIIGRTEVISMGQEVLTEKEVRLIALQYKTEFEHIYHDLFQEAFWDMEVSDGVTFETYVKEAYIFEECRKLLYLSQEAGKLGITLTVSEEEQIEARADAYMNALSEDALAFSKTDRKTVISVLSLYQTGSKVIEALISDKRLEVSDEESRIADIGVIRLSSEETARAVYERLKNGEDFRSVAEETTTDPVISYSVSKTDVVPELASVLFSMTDNELSGIIRAGDAYYIIRMDQSYNTLLSLNNQRNLVARKRYAAWAEGYEDAEKEMPVKRNKAAFDEIRLNVPGDFPYVSLFSDPKE